jgi:hypothetical protein
VTAEELIAAIEQLEADGHADMECGVTLVFGGRWTGIKGVSAEDGVVYIESTD